jgi:hypothetical protein
MKVMLVIVPCGKAKIWDKWPNMGGVHAKDAYIGPSFKRNRAYAERFAEKWTILSAKYGFIPPEFIIPSPYNVTFKDKSTSPIGYGELKKQVLEQGLDAFEQVVGLGGKEYREAILASFPSKEKLRFPFGGFDIFKTNRGITLALRTNNPFPDTK